MERLKHLDRKTVAGLKKLAEQEFASDSNNYTAGEAAIAWELYDRLLQGLLKD